jgi:hypothetical protein
VKANYTIPEERMKQYQYVSLERKLETLKNEFPSFMEKLKGTKNDFTRGKIISIREAKPSQSLVRDFCGGREKKRKHRMALGIMLMFHGTHKDSIQSILREGIYDMSHFTSSFHYAATRSQYMEHYFNEVSHILAFAVLVKEKEILSEMDVKTRSPCREYALPLYIITVKDTSVRTDAKFDKFM